MSILYLTEVSEIAFDAQGNPIMAPDMPGLAEQSIAIGGVSVPSAAFSTATRYILLHTDVNCCLGFATAPAVPTALVGYHRMAQNETRFYGVNPGDKVAVISSA